MGSAEHEPITGVWAQSPQRCPGQCCIAKNGGGYTQTGVAKGLKVPSLFMIAEVSIRCQKNPGGVYTPYTRVHHWSRGRAPGRGGKAP